METVSELLKSGNLAAAIDATRQAGRDVGEDAPGA
jgi:hypothetical protein